MTAQQFTEQYVPLPAEAKRQIDDFVAFINQRYAPSAQLTATRVQGIPGRELLRFAGTIEADDLELMQKAIDEDFGKVDLNEW